MAIRIFSDRIQIGNFTLSEKTGGLSGINVFAAEKRKSSLSFNGVLSVSSTFNTDAQATIGTFAGGAINPLSQSWAGIDRFPFSTISSVKSIGSLYQSRTHASGASSRTNGYTFGGVSGTVSPFISTNTGASSNVDRFPFSNDLTAKLIGNIGIARCLMSSQSSSSGAYCVGGVPFTNTGGNTTFSNFVQKFSFAQDGLNSVVANLAEGGYGRTGFSSSIAGYYSSIIVATWSMRNNFSPDIVGKTFFAGSGWSGVPPAPQRIDIGPTPYRILPAALSAKNGKFPFSAENEISIIPTFTCGTPTVMTGLSAPDAGYYASISNTTSMEDAGVFTPTQTPTAYSLKIDKFPFSSEVSIQGIGHLYGAHHSTIYGRYNYRNKGGQPFSELAFTTDFNFLACSSGDAKGVLGGGSQGEDGTNWFGNDKTPNIYYKMTRLDSFPFVNSAFCTYVGDLATGRSGMVGHSDK